MMKNLTCLIVLLLPLLCKAQTFDHYKATNGINYRIGDTVKLGRGTGESGAFLYIEDRGIPSPSHTTHALPKQYANGGVIIKAIKKTSLSGIDKYFFVVSTGGLFRFSLFIDDAISACEVLPCAQQGTAKQTGSLADEIKKLKDLLDSGAITPAEYDTAKKKLLSQ